MTPILCTFQFVSCTGYSFLTPPDLLSTLLLCSVPKKADLYELHQLESLAPWFPVGLANGNY